VTELEKLLAHPEYKSNQIYHYTSTQPEKTANAAFLMGAFQVLHFKLRSFPWVALPNNLLNLSKIFP